MYNNLEAELKRKKILRKDLAEGLNLTISTVSQKLNGKANLTLPEALAIKKFLKVDIPLEKLFAFEDDKQKGVS
ncbi:MAG: helix-turn-helix transcriptional regulator [Clostridium butyricum]|uniref:helix-turn-helix transcriptional regulator n=1 Tax=unclassified Clostridium TaxID=2614128 RepID=UPI0022542B34|nr:MULTISPECIES: helix-turn-helix transcriptional regulator [unclassified Clostridium]MDU7711227.1 helix-turn-helix transcriptional regulator [Clostridium butyricum]MDU1115291.1 helix-turn-helix transcriptional regulator [Clostridium sp.]MDU1232601.1 helix-turn-helix transcriptional regulator [Clostridium sp.]MDU3091720.1 helix-turn-helix transcriptional regulator [Clostridium sp.]UZT07876.1 helix-turn-helix transcriptional regulator [Clostridium sp. LQ25]